MPPERYMADVKPDAPPSRQILLDPLDQPTPLSPVDAMISSDLLISDAKRIFGAASAPLENPSTPDETVMDLYTLADDITTGRVLSRKKIAEEIVRVSPMIGRDRFKKDVPTDQAAAFVRRVMEERADDLTD